MISNSSHDENGRLTGGRAGDQDGTEWRIQSWYRYPYGDWDCVIRHPKSSVRKELAKLSRKAANNNKIGYDQSQRTTYWTQLKKANYDPSKINAKCESDCSAGVSANAKAVGYRLNIPALKEIPITTYTGNMREVFKKAGFKILTDKKYTTSQDYLYEGDILLRTNHHTCVCVTTGRKAGSENAAYPVDYLYKGVNNSSEVKKLQKCLNKIDKANLEVDGIFGAKTLKAVKNFQKKNKLKPDGIVGEKTCAALKKYMR